MVTVIRGARSVYQGPRKRPNLREGEQQLPHTNQNMPVGTKGSRPYRRIYKEED